VGGAVAHDTGFQGNPWTIAQLAQSPRILEVTADYRAHKTSRCVPTRHGAHHVACTHPRPRALPRPTSFFEDGPLKSIVKKQESDFATADKHQTTRLPRNVANWLAKTTPTGYEADP
jgi:hypothetical protein